MGTSRSVAADARSLLVGRHDLITELTVMVRNSARQQGPAVLVLTGPPGVGKSALASVLLRTVAAGFPQGRLTVRLGAGGQAITAFEALGRLLRRRGVPFELIREDLAERAAHWQAVTARGGFAVLLDGAVSAEQVGPLVPAAGNLVVVTSRAQLSELARRGARAIEVGPLSATQSLTMLAAFIRPARLKADTRASDSLVRLAAGRPRELRVLGSALARRPEQTLNSALTELVAPERGPARSIARDRPATRILDFAYRTLPLGPAAAYRLLGVLPAGIADMDVPLVAAAAKLARPAAKTSLTELVAVGLVQASGQGRFVLPDAMRVHAADLAAARSAGSTSWEEVVARRVVDYLLRLADSSDRLLAPHRRRVPTRSVEHQPIDFHAPVDQAQALDRLEANQRAIAVATSTALDRGWDVAAWQIVDASRSMFVRLNAHQEALAVYGSAIQAAQRCADVAAQARLVRAAATSHRGSGDLTSAHAGYRRAGQLCRALGDTYGMASTRIDMALTHLASADVSAAHADGERALKLALATGNTRLVARVRHVLGVAALTAQQWDEALAALRAAVVSFAETTDQHGLARSRRSLGRVLIATGQHGDADAELRRSLAAFRAIGGQVEAVRTLVLLGENAEGSGDRQAALRWYRAAHQSHLDLLSSEPDDALGHLVRLSVRGADRDG